MAVHSFIGGRLQMEMSDFLFFGRGKVAVKCDYSQREKKNRSSDLHSLVRI